MTLFQLPMMSQLVEVNSERLRQFLCASRDGCQDFFKSFDPTGINITKCEPGFLAKELDIEYIEEAPGEVVVSNNHGQKTCLSLPIVKVKYVLVCSM